MLLIQLDDFFPGPCGISGGIKGFIGFHEIDQMVGDTRPLFGSGLGRTDIHILIDLHGIRPDDLTRKVLRQIDGNRGLTDAGRTANNDYFGFSDCSFHGWQLLIVTPIGGPRVMFNAHRVYSYEQVTRYFADVRLLEFTLIPDNAAHGGLVRNATREMADAQRYGCGCFWFRK